MLASTVFASIAGISLSFSTKFGNIKSWKSVLDWIHICGISSKSCHMKSSGKYVFLRFRNRIQASPEHFPTWMWSSLSKSTKHLRDANTKVEPIDMVTKFISELTALPIYEESASALIEETIYKPRPKRHGRLVLLNVFNYNGRY